MQLFYISDNGEIMESPTDRYAERRKAYYSTHYMDLVNSWYKMPNEEKWTLTSDLRVQWKQQVQVRERIVVGYGKIWEYPQKLYI